MNNTGLYLSERNVQLFQVSSACVVWKYLVTKSLAVTNIADRRFWVPRDQKHQGSISGRERTLETRLSNPRFYMKYLNRSFHIGHSLSCKLSLMRNAVNVHQIWRTQLSLFLSLQIHVFYLKFEIKRIAKRTLDRCIQCSYIFLFW